MKLPKIPKAPRESAKLKDWVSYHEDLGRYLKVWAQVEQLASGRISTPRSEYAEEVMEDRKRGPKYRKQLKSVGAR